MTRIRRTAIAVALVCAYAASASDWYVSDATGIALQRTTAERAKEIEYGLSVEDSDPASADSAPEALRAAVPAGGSIEKRTLYRNGAVSRTRWAALDPSGNERFVETRDADGPVVRERYDAARNFIEEGRFAADGTGTVIRYAYSASRLVRADAFSVAGEETPLWTQTYRYLRSGALREVERTEFSGDGKAGATDTARFDSSRGVPRSLETRSSDGSTFRTRYDESGRVAERESTDAAGKTVAAAEITNAQAGSAEGPATIAKTTEADGTVVVTGYDERGHVVSERRTDSGGSLLSETRKTWTGNRVASIEILAGSETRRTEYEYDASEKRIMERNYRNGTLERTVRTEGGEDTEELYSDGVPVLRAVWVDGRKISERRLERKGEGTR